MKNPMTKYNEALFEYLLEQTTAKHLQLQKVAEEVGTCVPTNLALLVAQNQDAWIEFLYGLPDQESLSLLQRVSPFRHKRLTFLEFGSSHIPDEESVVVSGYLAELLRRFQNGKRAELLALVADDIKIVRPKAMTCEA